MTKTFEQLLEEFLTENISPEDLKIFLAGAKEHVNAGTLSNKIEEKLELKMYKGLSGKEDMEIKFQQMLEKASRMQSKEIETIELYPPKKFFNIRRIAAAASIILILSTGAYFLFFNKTQKQIAVTETQQQRFKNDVAPGGNKAILTLADGTQIVLDSAANGTISQQGSTKIIKLDSGQLAYNAVTANGEILYNTISTPKGGQYQIILADGSKVWLNAASSLRFPTSFSKERNVELTGEGYFEVAHNAAKPFQVFINGMNIEVLGTHFNVNGYDDENSIRTTLLEGSVKIASTVLKPGQQARFDNNPSSSPGQVISVVTADVDEVMAWKEGRFHFDGADIKTIMRQLSRWYDVEVNYQSNISDFFVAEISRDVPVSKLLQLLELTNLVHFKIEGNKITVMK